MNKVLKTILSLIVIVLVSVNITGCGERRVLDEFSSLSSSNKNYIIFDGNKVEKNEVLEYESPYKDASASFYEDKLTDEEKELYKAFVYAYEHKYNKIKYYSKDSNLGKTYEKIVQSICAENPFIDWNQEYTYSYNSGCYEFTSTQLDKEDVDLKIQAYNKAKELVKSIPKNYSTYDKLLWIYNYIVNNVKYVDDAQSYLESSPSFIYDGLIGGKTQCTGFSDIMTMMCNLAGIQSITVCGKVDEGHAWNLVNLDGQFYYCDATSDSGLKTSLPENAKSLNLSFLKSDEIFDANGYSLMDNVVIQFPKAQDKRYDSNNIDYNLADFSNENDLSSIAKKLMNEKSYVVVHLKEVSTSNTKNIDNAANYILKYISKNMRSSKYKYVTIHNLISEGSNDIVFFVEFK